jgi:hypothetical protein
MKKLFNTLLLFFALVSITAPVIAQRNVKVIESFQFVKGAAQNDVLTSVDNKGNAAWVPASTVFDCCVPDSAFLQYITTQCSTITGNRNQVLLVDSNGNATTTACQRIQYLEIDSLFANYFFNNTDTNFFKLGSGANSLMDKRSNDAGGEQSSVFGFNNTIGFSSTAASAIGWNNYIGVYSLNSNAFGFNTSIADSCINCSAFGVTNSFQSTSNSNLIGEGNTIELSSKSNAFGHSNYIFNSDSSFVIGMSSIINEKNKSYAIGINANPTLSNQLCFSDSFSTMKLNLNGATEGKLLTVNSSGLAEWGNSITSGSGAPATTPAKIGDMYIDTSNRKLYFAVGTTNSADWEIAN